jgi:hypothetical protein
MARHGWWEPHGVAAPAVLPRTFYDLGQQLGGGSYSQPLYYAVGAAVIRLTGSGDLEHAYWALRALGMLLGAATILCIWAGSRLLLGGSAAAGVAAVAAVFPQFVLTALTVSPDVVVIALGGVIWCQVARLLRGHRPALSAILIMLAALAAVLAKRSALPLAAAALVSTLWLLAAGTGPRGRRRAAIVAAAFVVAGLVLAAVVLFAFQDVASNLLVLWQQALRSRRGIGQGLEPPLTLPILLSVVPAAIDHVWLNAGWSRFPAPESWAWLARIVTVAGFLGATAAVLRRAGDRRPLVLAFLFVGIQFAAILAIFVRNAVGPEARFLFPVFAPALTLMWTGWMWLVPAPARRHAPVLLVGAVAALDISGFLTVVVPAYLP